MVYTERGILKRSVSIMMTNFLKWKHDGLFWRDCVVLQCTIL